MNRRLVGILLAGLSLALFGCRSVYYSAMESVGVYKRDLLKKEVVAARDEQKEAGEQFQDALTRLKSIYGFDGAWFVLTMISYPYVFLTLRAGLGSRR